jgi:hypothetical protein
MSKNSKYKNFTGIHLVGAELFHVDGQTGGHDEANSCISLFFFGERT